MALSEEMVTYKTLQSNPSQDWSYSLSPDGALNISLPYQTDIFEDITANVPPDSDLRKPVYLIVLVCIFYPILFVLGIVGNMMVILVVWRNKTMRNSTNIFLVNLGVTDFCVILVCMPFAMLEFFSEEVWYLGDVLCRMFHYLENVAVHASAITIVAISFERYYAICRPLRAQSICTVSRTVKVIITIWLLTLLWTSPYLAMARTVRSMHATQQRVVNFCELSTKEDWRRGLMVANLVLFFLVPLAVLIVLYGCIVRCLVADTSQLHSDGQSFSTSARKQRRQVVLMLLAVIALFFICLLPFRVFLIWNIFTNDDSLIRLGFVSYMNILSLARFLFYLNSTANPILYNVFSTKFRTAFKKLCFTCRQGSARSRGRGHSEHLMMNSNGQYCYKHTFPAREATSVTRMDF